MKNIKKINPNSTTHSASSVSFRVLVKNRNNKHSQQLDSHCMSTNFNNSQVNEDTASVRSKSSHYSIKAIEPENQKIKKYVRAMKEKTQPIPSKKQRVQSRHSQRSCGSKVSKAQSTYSKNDFDCKSTTSKKDFSLNCSIHINETPTNIILNSSQPKQKIERLIKLQQKIDTLIKSKLNSSILRQKSRSRFQTKPFMGASGNNIQLPQESELQSQLKTILETIRMLKQRQEEDNDKVGLEEDIFQLAKKIQILQKIIASSSTQSDILKKYYFANKSQKYPHLNTKSRILDQISKRKSLFKSNHLASSDCNSQPKSSIGKYLTTSKGTYMKPAKEAYKIEKSKYSSFIANRQPLPRSNYNCQFLNYGILPIFKYKPQDAKLSTSCLGTKTSNYQQNFRDKTSITNKHLDYKQMDCYKDKFRNSNISFMETCRKKDWTMEQKRKKGQVKSSKKSKQNYEILTEHQKLKNVLQTVHKLRNTQRQTSNLMGQTETNSSFVWHKRQSQVSVDPNRNNYGKTSLIKNSNLQKLKNMYKAAAMRG